MKKSSAIIFLAIFVALYLWGCSKSVEHVEDGDTVQLDYVGKLEDGSVFDSSAAGEPIEFTVGSAMIIPGLEKGIMGMTIGETKTITIPADEAYGPPHPELVMTVPKDKLPQDMELEVGGQLESHQPDGRVIYATITEIKDDSVTLDANHPLAGKTLIFDVKVVGISKAKS
jgi:FKBP-type peptidyl-prolyl cis-trans isomerase 2